MKKIVVVETVAGGAGLREALASTLMLGGNEFIIPLQREAAVIMQHAIGD